MQKKRPALKDRRVINRAEQPTELPFPKNDTETAHQTAERATDKADPSPAPCTLGDSLWRGAERVPGPAVQSVNPIGSR